MVIFNKLPTYYADGTATVAANGTTVTGNGTVWTNLQPGDLFGVHKGLAIPIAEVVSATSITLQYPWSGAAQTNAAYCVQLVPRSVGVQEATRQLLLMLANGNLDSFANISGEADALPIFTGAGALTKILPAALLAKMGTVPNAQLPKRLMAGLEGGLTDCNLFMENGWAFAGPSAINRPPGIDFALLHYRGDSANGQQWGQDVFSGIKYRRRLDSFNWQAWGRVYEAESELDARYNRLSQTILNEQLPKRLGEICYAITDWNEARKNGCYMADGAAHAPAPSGWYVGYTLVRNDFYVIQRASGLFDGITWERICTNGSFSSWVRVRTREWELDERYNRLGVAISRDQLPGIMAPTRFDSYVSARAGSGSENGYIQMSSGNSQVTGGLELWQANGQRASYFGYADTTNKNINITAENGYRFSFNTSGGRGPAIDGQNIVTAADFGSSLARNGWQRLPSGLILQWGAATVTGGNLTVAFPTAFPNACYGVFANVNLAQPSATVMYSAWADTWTLSNFVMRTRYAAGGTVAVDNMPANFWAVGR